MIRLRTLGLGLAGAVAGVVAAWRWSPRPAAFLVREVMTRHDAKVVPARNAAIDALAPEGLAEHLDVAYGPAAAQRLDVFTPPGGPHPTVVWVHGGAFVAGTKDDLRPWFRVLAGRGITVVGVDYTLAPAASYPSPVRDLAAALDHVVARAADLGIDPTRIVLAGDSAGAHIAAQAAFAVVDADYATAAGLPRPVPPATLVGLLLCCGVYDLALGQSVTGPFGPIVRGVLHAYTGVRDTTTDPALAFASLVDHVPSNLPPTYLTAGNADPLAPHTARLARALTAAGVEVDLHDFVPDHEPRLDHEYQVDLRLPDARAALDRMATLVLATGSGVVVGGR